MVKISRELLDDVSLSSENHDPPTYLSQTSNISAVQPFLDKLEELTSPPMSPQPKIQQVKAPKQCKRKSKRAKED